VNGQDPELPAIDWPTALDLIERAGHTLGPRAIAAGAAILAVTLWLKLRRRTRRRIRRRAWRCVAGPPAWVWHQTRGNYGPAPRRPGGPLPHRSGVGAGPGGPTVLYRHYDANDRLLYVGITDASRGGRRWNEHADDKPWFHLVARSSISDPYPTRAAALYAEACAIRDERPIHNISRPDPANIGRAGLRQ
jgi:hypothetical protein